MIHCILPDLDKETTVPRRVRHRRDLRADRKLGSRPVYYVPGLSLRTDVSAERTENFIPPRFVGTNHVAD